jgi:hypothetical protein
MSVGTPQPVASPASAPPSQAPREIKIVSHSNLFYWWPVWAAGFLMALITLIDGHHMAVVPADSKTNQALEVTLSDGTKVRDRSVIVAPEKKKIEDDPKLHMSGNKLLGVFFAMILVLVIVITNVPLRGMWSILVIIGIFTLILILRLAGVLEQLYLISSQLDIRLNLGGYLFISVFLFAIWCVTIFFFDRRIYIVFTPRQFKVCTEVGGGEKVFDAMGMTMEKQQSDFFRHKIIGLGAGDLVVKTAGAQSQHFDLPNVLFINNKVQAIEALMGKQVVENK